MLKKNAVVVMGAMLFFVMFGLGSNVYAAGKFGYVDLSTTFDKYEKTKTYDDELTAVQTGKEKELEQLSNDAKSIEDKMPLLSEKEKVTKQKELEEKKNKLSQLSQQIALDLRKDRDEKLKDVLQDIEKIIQSYAQKNGYDFIFNDRVLLYGNATADVTADIVDLLNVEYKGKGKQPEKVAEKPVEKVAKPAEKAVKK